MWDVRSRHSGIEAGLEKSLNSSPSLGSAQSPPFQGGAPVSTILKFHNLLPTSHISHPSCTCFDFQIYFACALATIVQALPPPKVEPMAIPATRVFSVATVNL